MRLKPPGFWQAQGGGTHPLALLLSPLGAAYAAAVAGRIARARPCYARIPVICTGNVTLGGVGKTPFTALIGGLLQEAGHRPYVLSRGYGGRLPGPLRVDPSRHGAADVGDEPLLLSATMPVFIGADRPGSAMAATGAGADSLLMDDGFQNPSLHKDLSFLLLDASLPLGNGRVFPAGPLREPAGAAVRRADALVAITEGPGPAPESITRLAQGRPVLCAWMEPDLSGFEQGQRVHALTGIARPERFFRSLGKAGVQMAGRSVFPDHHPFNEAEIETALAAAKAEGARLVTTAKDHVRIPAGLAGEVTAIPAAMTTGAREHVLAMLEQTFERFS